GMEVRGMEVAGGGLRAAKNRREAADDDVETVIKVHVPVGPQPARDLLASDQFAGRSSSSQSRSMACPLSLTGRPRALRPLRRSSNSNSPNVFTTAEPPFPSGSRFRSYIHDSLRGRIDVL